MNTANSILKQMVTKKSFWQKIGDLILYLMTNFKIIKYLLAPIVMVGFMIMGYFERRAANQESKK